MKLASLLVPSLRSSSSDEREQQFLGMQVVGGRRTKSGETITPEASLQLSAYFACLRNLSEDVGKLPLILYRRSGAGKERAADHPLYRLLHDSPNPTMSSMTLRETLTHWAAAWGDGYAEIERDARGEPVALWPIHPSRVTVRRTTSGGVAYDVRADVRVQGATMHGVRLAAEDVFHLHGLGDGLTGYSVARFAAESLGLTMAAQTFGAAFFGNGASMSGVLTHPAKLTPEARTNLRESWQAMHGGARNAAKTGILEEGIKYERIGIPPEEAQFLETRQFQTVEVCRWFRMPPHKIQDLTRSTFSNIEAQNTEYVVDTLMPWAMRWEHEIRRKLILPTHPDDDLFAELLFAALLRGDQNARSNYYRTLVNIGVMSPNEVRALENMNPGGKELDSYFMQSNMLPLDQVGKATTRADLGAAIAKPGRQAPAAPAEVDDEDDTEADATAREQQLEAQVAALRPVFLDAAARVLNREAAG
ncbi:MAG TPA: phage portal protein, partial [Anaeromyxobacteraceae bacterium]|nr:phage portal protein [Anaeromyxobacteraceae bacterium]